MLRISRIVIAVTLWIIAVALTVTGYNPLESALYAAIAVFIHPFTSRFLISRAQRLAGWPQ